MHFRTTISVAHIPACSSHHSLETWRRPLRAHRLCTSRSWSANAMGPRWWVTLRGRCEADARSDRDGKSGALAKEKGPGNRARAHPFRGNAAEIGHKIWAIAEGYIPGESASDERALESHETACILNATSRDAKITIPPSRTRRGPFVTAPRHGRECGGRFVTLHPQIWNASGPEVPKTWSNSNPKLRTSSRPAASWR